MKRVFLVIIALAIALVLLVPMAGCTVEVTPLSSSESSSSSSSKSSSSSSSKSSSSSSESSSESSRESSSESSSQAPSEPSRPESGSESGPQQEEIEGKVAYSLIKMFEKKRFYLRFLGDMGTGQTTNSVMEFAMQDDKIAVRMEVDETGVVRVVMEGDEMACIFDGMRAIMYMPVTEENDLSWDSMNTQGLQYVGMGSEEFRGRILAYEEYLAESTTTRYFFSGKNVVGIRSISPGEEPMDMEILEMSENIPIGFFDIPKDYMEISGDQAF